jgi:probable rRNA maturation factor
MPVHMQSQVRRVTFDQARLDRLARSILSDVGEASAELGILFVGDQRMRSLNRQYRDKDRTTECWPLPCGRRPIPTQACLEMW